MVVKLRYLALIIAGLFLASIPAQANFILSNAIIEFSPNSPNQQDIEIISRSDEADYIVTETYEVSDPGTPKENKQLVDDAEKAGLLVTPDKTILPPNGRRLVRFVLLRPRDNIEHIYRVAIKPVIKGLKADTPIGLKVLVGYETLVIVRPAQIISDLKMTRKGRVVEVVNNGNSNIIIQSGKQCPAGSTDDKQCQAAPTIRVYAGGKANLELPLDAPVTYSVWDGAKTSEHNLE